MTDTMTPPRLDMAALAPAFECNGGARYCYTAPPGHSLEDILAPGYFLARGRHPVMAGDVIEVRHVEHGRLKRLAWLVAVESKPTGSGTYVLEVACIRDLFFE